MFFQKLGRKTLEFWELVYSWVAFLVKLSTSFDKSTRFKSYLEVISELGTKSLPVVAVMSIFVGGVMAVQSEYTLKKFGAEAFTGSAVALAVIRELSPVLTALILIGRNGSSIAAETGVMKITDQIDALRSMGINFVSYHLTPRFYGFVITFPILTVFSMVIAIGSAYFFSVNVLGLSRGTFVTQMQSAVEAVDIYAGLVKTFFFGVIAGLVSIKKGFFCEISSYGVNKATTEAVVYASIAVLIADFVLTSLLVNYVFS